MAAGLAISNLGDGRIQIVTTNHLMQAFCLYSDLRPTVVCQTTIITNHNTYALGAAANYSQNHQLDDVLIDIKPDDYDVRLTTRRSRRRFIISSRIRG